MKILWFTWKDLRNRESGGAEVVNEELAKRLAQEGHEVTFLVRSFEGGSSHESHDGYSVIRVGGKVGVYWQAYRYYKKNFKGKFNLVIDEVNTIPFFAKWYVKEKNILFVHQLAREIWFYEMFFPLSLIGYLLEPFYLWLLRDRRVITVSESTKQDLIRYGFRENNISIISEGVHIPPLESLQPFDFKLTTLKSAPTILSLGAIRSMKRTHHIIQAFEIAKKKLPELKLVIAGMPFGPYGKRVLTYIHKSAFQDSIHLKGKVSNEEKIELLCKAHLVAVTSVKEGWGLIVTEAASQGTPAVVYNVSGLRDSVRDGITGLISKENNPTSLAESMITAFSDEHRYQNLRQNAWEWSKEITFERAYKDFQLIVNK